MGGVESLLQGSLESNGSVFLINPQGIVIDKGARIDTAGFLASTADIFDGDFLSGKLLFSGDSRAAVVNLGTIECATGDVTLIAKAVRNEGEIRAPQGVVSLAAAKEVMLQLDGPERVFIRPEAEKYLVEHLGDITAVSVEIRNAGSPYAQAIKSSGRIDALKRQEENGRVYLVAEQGKVEVFGEIKAEGGTVHVLGDYVRLDGQAKIDVSGADGGGEVLFGGDFQGKNDEIHNARAAYVDINAVICADALESGDGGKVIVWSNLLTGFYGTVSAEGGKDAGDGGLVEVSGGYLDYQGMASTRALKGKWGELLLDPNDITISTAVDCTATPYFNLEYFDGVDGVTFVPCASAANLNNMTLENQLNLNNVTIATSDPTVGGAGVIQFQDSVTWVNPTQLTVRATSQIHVASGVGISATTGGGGATFTAIYFLANADHNTLPASPGLTTSKAGILIEGRLLTTDGNIYLNGSGGDTGADNRGIELFRNFVAQNIASTNGSITLIGKAGPENAALTNNNYGVYIHSSGSSQICVESSGPISIIGQGGANSGVDGDRNTGVLIESAQVKGNGFGDILIQGTGGFGLNSNHGVNIDDGLVTNASGGIKVIGEGNGTQTANRGVSLDNNGSITSTAMANGNNRTLLVQGTGSPQGSLTSHGVVVTQGAVIASVDYDVAVVGFGGGSAAFATSSLNRGVQNQGAIDSVGDGNISITGYGGGLPGVTTDNHGIEINFGGTVDAANGNITLFGEGGTSNSTGVVIDTGAVRTTPGSIAITGISSLAGSNIHGVFLLDALVQTESLGAQTVPGSLVINGLARGMGSSITHGILMQNSTTSNTVQTNNFDILMTGINTSSGDTNEGITIESTAVPPNLISSVIALGTGSIFMEGTSTPNGTLTGNSGVVFRGLSTNETLVRTSSGDIFITGHGGAGALGNSNGIDFVQNSIVASDAGNIVLKGNANASGSDNYGIVMKSASRINSINVAQTGFVSLEGSSDSAGLNNNIGVALFDCPNGILTDGYDINIVGHGSGRATGVSSHGVLIGRVATFSDVFSTNGNIFITGVGGSATASDGVGLVSDLAVAFSEINVFDTGNISIIGNTRGIGGRGVNIQNNGLVETASGDISIVGNSEGTMDNNFGIAVIDSLVRCNGASKGVISLSGQGSIGGMSNNIGVLLRGTNTFLVTAQHDIEINGRGGGTANSNHGIFIDSGPIIQSSGAATSAGTIRLDGTASAAGTDSNVGVVITGSTPLGAPSTIILSTVGDIYIAGEGAGTGNSNSGVILQDGAQVISLGTMGATPAARVTVFGKGSRAGANDNYGVMIATSIDGLSSAEGDIEVTGIGGGSGFSNVGIYMAGGATISSTGTSSNAARINFSGTGGSGISSNAGIRLEGVLGGAVTTVNSINGNITLTGKGQGSGNVNNGIFMINDASVASTGAAGGPIPASITLFGQGSSSGVDTNNGIWFSSVSQGVSTRDGDVNIFGFGGGTGINNHGIRMTSSNIVDNNSFVSPSGSFQVYGKASTSGTGNCVGVFMETGSGILANEGGVSVTGIGGGSGMLCHGIEMDNGCTIQLAGAGSTASTAHNCRLDGSGSDNPASTGGIGVFLHTSSNSIASTNKDIVIRARSGFGAGQAMTLTNGNILITPGPLGNIDIATKMLDVSTGGDFSMSNGSTVQASPTGTLTMNIARHLIMTGGNGIDTNISCPGGAMVLHVARNLTMTGGAGVGDSCTVQSATGSMAITVGNNLILAGGSGSGAYVQIGEPTAAATANIVFPHIGGNVTLTGDAYALIGHGNNSMTAATLAGNISFDNVAGFVSINGATVGAGIDGFAQIGHLNSSIAGTPAISGNIYINANGTDFMGNSISLIGGTTSADTRARIGHGGETTAAGTTFGASTITLIGASNITLTTNSGQAQIENLSATPGSGAITIITDNSSPLDPNFGANGFNMNAGSLLANNFAASGGQLRIYTVNPANNILPAGIIINGVAFTSTGGLPDTTTERYGHYYGDGVYFGPEFSFYYKTPFSSDACPPCPPPGPGCPVVPATLFVPAVYQMAVANTEFASRFDLIGQPYHSIICMQSKKAKRQCDPNYRRFYTFIFENGVY